MYLDYAFSQWTAEGVLSRKLKQSLPCQYLKPGKGSLTWFSGLPCTYRTSAVVDPPVSTLSRQLRVFDCPHTILTVSTVFCKKNLGSGDPPDRDSHDCRDTGGPTIDSQVLFATTALYRTGWIPLHGL